MPIDVDKRLRERAERREQENLKSVNAHLLDEIESLRQQVKFYDNLVNTEATPIVAKQSGCRHEATVITALSDIHYEERITKASTNGLNEYSPSISRKRLQTYFVNLLKLTENNRHDVTIDNLVLALLGDNIHGFIHDEYLSTNYMTPIQASYEIVEHLIGGIKYLLDNGKFKHITVVCKVGNHSRTTEKIYSDTELVNSYEFLIYKFIAKYFQEKYSGAIDFVIDDSYFSYVSVYGKTIRFEHGHAFKYAGGIGGIYVPLMRHLLRGNKNRPFDLAVMGHWHQFETISNCLINGSVCGFNAYSDRKGFQYSDPMQQFQLVDSKYGFTVNSKVFLL